MYEGAYRILRALGDGRLRSRDEVAKAAGEAASVVREVVERYPKWFEEHEGTLRCTKAGFAALGREMVARSPATLDHTTEATDATAATWRRAYEALSESRGAPKRELDQVYVTVETAVRRAELLLRAGEHQRGLVCLGDDDLTSAAVMLAGAGRKVTAIDTDEDVLSVLSGYAAATGAELDVVRHDLRHPLPSKMKGRFGAVFTDPPYAVEGFTLFISRAIEILKPDGRLYVCFGQSRRASERGLQKQKVLGEAGLLIEAVFEDFNEYDGALSIGSRSALWRCRITPQSRPLVRGEVDGPLYTSRPAGDTT